MLWIAAAAGIAGVRAVAQDRAGLPGVFPLPAPDGCWQGVCFYTWPDDAIISALDDHPLVVQSAMAARPGGYHHLLLDTSRDPAQSATTGVMLSWNREGYTLVWDWMVPDNPPLMTLGDLLRATGAPDRVRVEPRGVLLWYADRRLLAVVQDAALWTAGTRLSPDDSVNSLHVPAPAYAPPQEFSDPAHSHPWRGYAAYRAIE